MLKEERVRKVVRSFQDHDWPVDQARSIQDENSDVPAIAGEEEFFHEYIVSPLPAHHVRARPITVLGGHQPLRIRERRHESLICPGNAKNH